MSYSHEDRAWLKRFSTHVAVLQRKGVIDLWSDERIAAGADWVTEIEAALSAAKVAVLLISPDFLASKFIWDNEMPRVMAHIEDGMMALPLLLRPCAWRLAEELERLQVRPRDGGFLSLGTDSQIDLRLSELTYELAARIGHSPAAPPLSEAEEPRRTPQQRRHATLLGRWDGHYNRTKRISLVIETLDGDKVQGRMEYPADGTSTIIEGNLYRRWSTDDPLWAQVGGAHGGNVHAVARFRETGYEKKGSTPVSFDGEYRVAFLGYSATGAWFSSDRLVGALTLQRERDRPEER